MEVPKKLEIKLPYDPVILLLSIYPKGNEITIAKQYLQPHVHCSVIYDSQDMERT